MDNLRGSLLMVAAMSGFALEDVLIKQMATALPMGQVLALIGCGGTLTFTALTRLRGKRVMSRAALSRAVMLRNVGEVIGSVTFVAALIVATGLYTIWRGVGRPLSGTRGTRIRV